MPLKELLAGLLKQVEDSRYILLLTKNHAALNIIQDQVPQVSSFGRATRLVDLFTDSFTLAAFLLDK